MLLFWLSQAAASLRRYELRRYEEDIPLNLWSPTHHSPLVRREYYFFLLGNKASRGAHRFHRSGLVGRAAEGPHPSVQGPGFEPDTVRSSLEAAPTKLLIKSLEW